MPMFFYKARDGNGALITGEVEATTANGLQESLFADGLIPVMVKEIKPGSVSAKNVTDWFNRVKAEELMIFTRQFYTLFKAGISMDTILGTLAKQIVSKNLKSVILKIRTDISGGSTLSQAFGRHPKVFNDLYISMLKAGEEAGILEQVLSELVKLIEKEEDIKRSIKAATLYPKIVIFVLVGAVTVLMTFVVPKFTTFYSHYGAKLPLMTQILIGTSNFIRSYWYIVLLVVFALAFAYRRYYNTKVGRLKIDELRFKLPVFGPLQTKVVTSRFGHILSSLYRSGLPMPRCLDVVANVIGNEAYSLEVRKLQEAIQRGSSMSDAMSQLQYFPPVIIETTAVGERTGALDEMLNAIADHYELEVTHNIKNLTTLLEPILLVVIFGMVATLALAIFMPIWSMSSIVK